ncbi:MAG: PEFG-CTERM sorting domain-containing protein [Nitrosopumilus sp.]|nr:PEFG-CTERM sorting domain-containing protein [Nitrosopumilus sp.]
MKIPTRFLLATSIVFGLIFVPAVLPANAQTVTIIEAAAEQYPIKIDDQSFVIFYGYGGSFEVGEDYILVPQPNLLSMSINPEQKSLEIEFEKLIEASLFWVLLPPDLISAEDYNFQVFVDEKKIEYDLVIHPNGPRVGFILPPNAEKVEIIGTKVIPEFGAIAGMILVLAIVSIIAVSAKARLGIISRF